MRYVLYALLTLAGLAAAAAAFVFIAFPTDFVRDELAARIKARTGRTLTITQAPSISFYPEPSVKLYGVTVSPPPGMSGEPVLSIDILTLKAPVWPLLWHQLTVESFELDHPKIVLRTTADGQRSWDLRKDTANETALRGSTTGEAASPPAATDPATPAAKPHPIAGLKDLRLHNVHIASGTLRVIDDRTGLDETLSDLTLDLNLDGIESPARIEGAATWSGEATKFKGTVGPASNLVSGDPVKLDLTFDGRLGKASIAATYSPHETTPLGGRIETSASSLRDLLGWLKHPLPAGSGLGPLTLAGNFGLSSEGFAARDATLMLDGLTGKGDFSVTHGKDKPMLRANLTLDRLDLNTYLGDPAPASAAATAAPAPAAVKDASKPEPAAPERAAAGQASAWSDDPIDLSVLRKLDADVTLALGALQWRSIKSGHAALRAVVKDGVLKSRLNELDLYGGKGSGSVSLDGRDTPTRLSANFALHGIQVQPFLSDAVGFGKLAGRGDLTFALAGNGQSQHEIVKGLLGQGRIELGEGAIVGFDLAAGVRGLQSGQLKAFKDQPTAQTGFSSLTASCTITNGVIDNRDLVIASPLGQLTGAGTVSLPDKTLDYTAQSSLAGAGDATALTVPLRVNGPWAKPAVTLDLKTIAKNPQAAVDTLTKAVGKFANSKQGKAIGDLIGGLLGKAPKQTDPAADQPPPQ